MANSGIASRWNELRGQNDWKGLLNHPLTDDDLRRYIIHYGRMVGAIGDIHNFNEDGKLPEHEFFEKACLVKGNTLRYEVKEYLTADNVVGFVATTTEEAKKEIGRRDILIAWRGTIGWKEWYQNIKTSLVHPPELFVLKDDADAKVHTGFWEGYKKVRDKVKSALTNLLHQYRNEEDISITVAGFSKGGAIAALNAMDIVYSKKNIRTDTKGGKIKVTAFTFGSPRVGNNGLKKVFDRLEKEHDLRLLRVRNVGDIVTYLPVSDYMDVGTELPISSNESTYLKKNNSSRGSYDVNPPSEIEEKEFINFVTSNDSTRGMFGDKFGRNHFLDVYLHLLALKKGESGELVDPNFALVNKYLGILDEKREIPKNWWEDKDHKGMVQRDDNGVWEFKPQASRSSKMGTKRALLVGCNYPKTSFLLHGCINDVLMMQELVQKKFGFTQENIKVLTDGLDKKPEDLPTREKILEQLGELVKKTEAGDVLFFQFSGHGTRSKQMEDGKRYTETEAIIPCDLLPITDMDLRHLIQDIDKETSFTILSDSCHSGGLIGQAKKQSFEENWIPENRDKEEDDSRQRFLPLATIISGIGTAVGFADQALTSITGQGLWANLGKVVQYFSSKNLSIDFKPEELQAFLNKRSSSRSMTEEEGILLSGCEDTEESADVWVDESTPHGAFTNAVLKVLEEQPRITNRELVNKVRSHLKDDGFKQHPCLYSTNGKAKDLFLGGPN